MLLWFALYKDKPQKASCTRERAPRARVLKRFDDAATLGMHDARAVHGMWLVDKATEEHDPATKQGDLIAFSGPMPPGDLAPRITDRTAVFPMGRAGLKEKTRR
jgi:hypothetical protein